VILRRTHPELPRSFRVPASPVLPLLAVLACAYLMLNLPVETWLRFMIWMLIGFVVYFLYGRRNSRVGASSD
jgi:APA family basic amino acid/polyamine antiporter